jgi:hypothetical protein
MDANIVRVEEKNREGREKETLCGKKIIKNKEA